MNKNIAYKILIHDGSIHLQSRDLIDYVTKRLNTEGRQYKERSTFSIVKTTLIGDDET